MNVMSRSAAGVLRTACAGPLGIIVIIPNATTTDRREWRTPRFPLPRALGGVGRLTLPPPQAATKVFLLRLRSAPGHAGNSPPTRFPAPSTTAETPSHPGVRLCRRRKGIPSGVRRKPVGIMSIPGRGLVFGLVHGPPSPEMGWKPPRESGGHPPGSSLPGRMETSLRPISGPAWCHRKRRGSGNPWAWFQVIGSSVKGQKGKKHPTPTP